MSECDEMTDGYDNIPYEVWPNTNKSQIDELREKIAYYGLIVPAGYMWHGEISTQTHPEMVEISMDKLMSLFTHQLELAKIEAKIEASQHILMNYWQDNVNGDECDIVQCADIEEYLSELTKQKEEIEK